MRERRGVAISIGAVLLTGGAFLLYHSLKSSSGVSTDQGTVRIDVPDIHLATEARRATISRETRLIDFGSEAGKRHYTEPDPRLHLASTGFKSIGIGEHATAAVACGEEAAVTFTALSPGDREVKLTVLLPPGAGKKQVIDIHLNDTEETVETITIDGSTGSSAHSFVLDKDSLRRGENELRFSFATTEPWRYQAEEFIYPAAAIFKSLEFSIPSQTGGSNDDRQLSTMGDSAPPPAIAAGDSLFIEQGTLASFPLRLPDGNPQFSAALSLHHPHSSDANRSVPVTVRMRVDPAGQLLLYKGHLDSSSRAGEEVVLNADLSVFRDSIVSIDFDVEATGDDIEPAILEVKDPIIHGGQQTIADKDSDRTALATLKEQIYGSNLVIFMADAAAAAYFTAYGSTEEFAPTIDGMAKEGFVFRNTISPASYTLASVGSLFTGMNPATHGVTQIGTSADGVRLSRDISTLAEYLQKHGYSTAALVTNPNAGASFGYDRGFSTYEALYDPALGFWQEGVSPDILAPRVAELIRSGSLQEPFFLYVHIFQPHAPYQAPERFREGLTDSDYMGPADGSRESIDNYRFHRVDGYTSEDFESLRRHYLANVRYADWSVGQVNEKLKQNGMLDRSLIVAVSDHGEAFGEHLSLEHGDTVFREEIDVPWVLRLPTSATADRREIEGEASLIDVTPTILSLLSIPTNSSFDGDDFAPALLGEKIPSRLLYTRSSGLQPRHGIRRAPYSYQEDLFTRQQTLFDLSEDPGETRSVLRERPILAAFLRQELCRNLCQSKLRAPEATVLDDEMLEQLREIGYVTIPDKTEPGEPDPETCPLLNESD